MGNIRNPDPDRSSGIPGNERDYDDHLYLSLYGGAVCGDHCSPISDTTIMASAGAQCNHVNHVTTQLPYAATVAVVSCITYVIAGFVQNALICLPIGMVLLVAALLLMKKRTESHS